MHFQGPDCISEIYCTRQIFVKLPATFPKNQICRRNIEISLTAALESLNQFIAKAQCSKY